MNETERFWEKVTTGAVITAFIVSVAGFVFSVVLLAGAVVR